MIDILHLHKSGSQILSFRLSSGCRGGRGGDQTELPAVGP